MKSSDLALNKHAKYKLIDQMKRVERKAVAKISYSWSECSEVTV